MLAYRWGWARYVLVGMASTRLDKFENLRLRVPPEPLRRPLRTPGGDITRCLTQGMSGLLEEGVEEGINLRVLGRTSIV